MGAIVVPKMTLSEAHKALEDVDRAALKRLAQLWCRTLGQHLAPGHNLSGGEKWLSVGGHDEPAFYAEKGPFFTRVRFRMAIQDLQRAGALKE